MRKYLRDLFVFSAGRSTYSSCSKTHSVDDYYNYCYEICVEPRALPSTVPGKMLIVCSKLGTQTHIKHTRHTIQRLVGTRRERENLKKTERMRHHKLTCQQIQVNFP